MKRSKIETHTTLFFHTLAAVAFSLMLALCSIMPASAQTTSTRDLRFQIDSVDQWLYASTAGLNAYEMHRNDNLAWRFIGATTEILGGEVGTLDNLRRDIRVAQSLVRRARLSLQRNHTTEAAQLLLDADQRSHNIRTRTTAFLEGIEQGGQRGISVTGFAPAAACIFYIAPVAAGTAALYSVAGAALVSLDQSRAASAESAPDITLASLDESSAAPTERPATAPSAQTPPSTTATPSQLPSTPTPPPTIGTTTPATPTSRNSPNPRAAELQRMLAAYRRLVANQEAQLRQMRARHFNDPVHLRTQTQLIEEARQAAIRWRQDGHPGLDWTQFLIESHGQMTQASRLGMRPPRNLNADEYQGWINNWHTLANSLKDHLSQAERQNWNLSYDALLVRLSSDRRRTPRRENINILDCIEGRATNARCEANLIWGVMHQLGLRSPSAHDAIPALELRAEISSTPALLTPQNMAQPPVMASISWNSESHQLRRPNATAPENGSTRGDLYQPSLLALSFIEQQHGERPFQPEEILIARRSLPEPVRTPIPTAASQSATLAPTSAPTSSTTTAAPPQAEVEGPTTAAFISNIRLMLQTTDPIRILASLRQLAAIPEAALNRIMVDAITNQGAALTEILSAAQRMNPDTIRNTIHLARSQVTGPEMERLSSLGQRLTTSLQSAPGATLFLLRHASTVMALRQRFTPLLNELNPPDTTENAAGTTVLQTPAHVSAAQEAASMERARRAIAEINAGDGGRDHRHTMTRLIQTTGAMGPRALGMALRTLSQLDPAALLQGMSMMGETNPQMLREIINQAQGLTSSQLTQLGEQAAAQQNQTREQATENTGDTLGAHPAFRACRAIMNAMSDQEKMEAVLTWAILATERGGIDTFPYPFWLRERIGQPLPAPVPFIALLPRHIQELLRTPGTSPACLVSASVLATSTRATLNASATGRLAGERFARNFIMESVTNFFERELSQYSPMGPRYTFTRHMELCSQIVQSWPREFLRLPETQPVPFNSSLDRISPWCTEHPSAPRLRRILQERTATRLASIPRNYLNNFPTLASGASAGMETSFYSPQNLLPLIGSVQNADRPELIELAAAQAAENILRELWADQSGTALSQTLRFTGHSGNFGTRAPTHGIEYFHHPEIFCREFYSTIGRILDQDQPLNYSRFIGHCTHTPEAQRITAMINHFRSAVRENPALAFGDRTEYGRDLPTQASAMLQSLNRVAGRQASIDHVYIGGALQTHSESGTPTNESTTDLNTNLLAFLADNSRLGALPPPPRLPPQRNRSNTPTTAPTTNPLDGIQLPAAATDDTQLLTSNSNPQSSNSNEPDAIQLLLVPAAPRRPTVATAPPQTPAQRRREAVALALYRPTPGRLQIPMPRLLHMLFENSNPIANESVLSQRWNANFVREIIQAAERDPLFRQANRPNALSDWDWAGNRLMRRVQELSSRSPGPIPGPFGHNISRDFARVLHLFLSRNNSGHLSEIQDRIRRFAAGDTRSHEMLFFFTAEQLNRFLTYVNTEFGPPHIPLMQAPAHDPTPDAAVMINRALIPRPHPTTAAPQRR